MDEFNTVFVFTEKANLIWQGSEETAFGIISFIASSIWALYTLYTICFRKNLRRITHLILAVILMIFVPGWISQGYEEMQWSRNEYSHLQKLYDSQGYSVAEGIVHVVKVGNSWGHDAGDIIHIGDVEFAISCWDVQFTYPQAIHCGGALTEGVFARVYYYVDGYNNLQIMRVDIKK